MPQVPKLWKLYQESRKARARASALALAAIRFKANVWGERNFSLAYSRTERIVNIGLLGDRFDGRRRHRRICQRDALGQR